jgi:hypothetical protein
MGVSGCVDLGSAGILSRNYSSINGASVNATIGMGLSLKKIVYERKISLPKIKFIDFDRLNVYMNAFIYNKTYKLSGKEIYFSTKSMMLRAQYKIFEFNYINKSYFTWNGINLNTGIEYNQQEISSKIDINVSQSYQDSGITGTSNVTGTITVGSDSYSLSIPLEVSTSIKMLYLTTIHFGTGIDFNLGKAKSISSLDSTLNITYSSATGSPSSSGEGLINMGSSNKPSFMQARVFGGIDFNLTKLKPYIQIQHNLFTGLWGINLGLKIIY